MTSAPALYESVAADLTAMLNKGLLRPGERLPSVRQLSAQKRISVSTVLQAYRTLEDNGLIYARPQSGYFVRARSLRQPPEPALTTPPDTASLVGVSALVAESLAARQKQGMVSFSEACPSPDLLPAARLRRLMATLAMRRPQALTTYAFPPGNEDLRRQIARRAIATGYRIGIDDIVITDGCMEALNLCLRAVAKPGDTIAFESPTYFGLLQIVESLGMKALEIPTHPREGISLDALELATRKRRVKACVVMPTVANPLGSVMPDENKARMVALLAARNVPLIEDDVYGDLHYAYTRPIAAKSYDKTGNVLFCSSFTKALAPGFRVGWVVPGRFRAQVEMLKFINTVATPDILQATIAEFLNSGGYDRHLRVLRKVFASQVARVSDAVSEYFPAGTQITRPQGGFLLWVALPGRCDTTRLRKQALAENISFMPGSMFTNSRNTYRNALRLSCGLPWSDRIDQGLRRLGELARAQR